MPIRKRNLFLARWGSAASLGFRASRIVFAATPPVVFVEGLGRWGGTFLFYYRGADKFIGVAEADEIKG